MGAVWARDGDSRSRVLLIMVRSGRMKTDTAGAVVRRGMNAVLVLPGRNPVTLSVTTSRCEFVYISTDMDALPPSAITLRGDITAAPISWERLAPLYAFVRAACMTAVVTRNDQNLDVLSSPAGEIVASLLRAMVHDLDCRGGLVGGAREVIRRHHTDANLTPSLVAERLGVSERTLQRAFAVERTGVQEELRRARAGRARRLARVYPHLTRAQLAELSGFSSLSALYRSLVDDTTTTQ